MQTNRVYAADTPTQTQFSDPTQGAGTAPRTLDPSQDCSVVTRDWLCKDAQTGGKNGLINVIDSVVNYMIVIFGGVAVILILWYIVTIIASAGSPDQIANAKKHLAQVAISLALLVTAYAIFKLVGISVNPAP